MKKLASLLTINGLVPTYVKKAFDTVNHEKLLHKLYHNGIRGPTHELLKSKQSSI